MDQSCAARTEKVFFENSKPVISVALLTCFLSASTLESSHLSI